jgi:hypothetical protein
MRCNIQRIVVTVFLLGIIFGISTVSATVENQKREIFNTSTYQIPDLQFDPLQAKVIVNRELSPDVGGDGSNDNIKRTFVEGTTSSIIPQGSIIYHSKEGITTVFDQTGKQILSANDSEAEMISTPVGLIPATHVHTSPTGSYSFVSENATYVVYNNTIIYVTVREKIDSVNNTGRDLLSEESTLVSVKSLDAQSVETDVINTTVMASAVVDNPGFHPGDTFTTQWIVPESPRQTGTFSPTYISLGENQEGSYLGNPEYHNIKAITEYDYGRNVWTMTTCDFQRYPFYDWEMSCINKFPIQSGDTMEGKIVYSNIEDSSNPYHDIHVFITDYNTAFGISSGFGYPVNQYTVTQLNLNLQGDVANLNDSTIIGNVTFSPVNLPASPTTYVDNSNSQLPNLNVENLWPNKIVFHTRTEPVVIEKTFSITNAWVYDTAPYSRISDGDDYIENVNTELKAAGWSEAFPMIIGTDVTKAQFGVTPKSSDKTLNDATLHWHFGHGSFPNESGNTAIVLKKINPSSPILEQNALYSSEITTKWGGKNKWVVLQTCSVLKDKSWGKVLGTTHGIFGFYTPSSTATSLPTKFLKNATSGRTLYDSWKRATEAEYRNTDQPTQFDKNGSVDFIHNTTDTFAAVIFKTKDQRENDHLPGTGIIALDGDPDNTTSVMTVWNCTSGEVFED